MGSRETERMTFPLLAISCVRDGAGDLIANFLPRPLNSL
jgi:hypothetical protein